MGTSSRTRATLGPLKTHKASVLLTQEEIILLIRALEDLIGDGHTDPDSVLAHQLTSRFYNIASTLVKPPERAN